MHVLKIGKTGGFLRWADAYYTDEMVHNNHGMLYLRQPLLPEAFNQVLKDASWTSQTFQVEIPIRSTLWSRCSNKILDFTIHALSFTKACSEKMAKNLCFVVK